MKNREKIVIVTWDFTEVSEAALLHAERYTKAAGSRVHVVHICGKKDNEQVLKEKIEKEIAGINLSGSTPIDVVVKKGSIYSSINKYTEEVKAELVIMGTHGIIGSQKLFGSKALKVIVGSKVPFLTVQQKPVREFKEMVLPFDSDMEGREKLRWVMYFANKYNLTIRILKKISSIKDVQKTINNNVAFAKRILDEYDIPYKVDIETNTKEFHDEVVNFAEKNRCGLIMVMTTKNIDWTSYLFGAEEQKIIANKAKIPVICVNPREDLHKPVYFNS
ncbi:MAG: universal stress protein [Bacteroidales bacterium]